MIYDHNQGQLEWHKVDWHGPGNFLRVRLATNRPPARNSFNSAVVIENIPSAHKVCFGVCAEGEN